MYDITLQKYSSPNKNQYSYKQCSPLSTQCQQPDLRKIISQYSQQNGQLILSQDFFSNIQILEQRYQQLSEPKWQSQVFQQLIQAYTDCVSYFSDKGQNVSQYFQNKIKRMLLSVKQFLKKNKREIVKANINNNILKQMQKEDIGLIMNRQKQKIQNTKKTIDQILKKQEDQLEQRRKIKKCNLSLLGTKSQSMITFSVESLSSNGSPIKNTQTNENKIKNRQFLFTTQILSQDDEQNNITQP